MRNAASLLPLALLLGACDLFTDATGFESEYVVESYQIVGEPLQSIRLSRTASVEETYDFNALAVREADVRVELLDESGGVEAAFAYAESANRPGVYLPVDGGTALLPLRTYRMTATTAEGDAITAETLTPGDVRLVNATRDTLVYQSAEQLELTAFLPPYPGRQNVFIFTAEALGPLSESRFVPISAATFDDGEELEDRRTDASPPINESNYELDAQGQITISVPWIIFTFYGPNRLAASALDDNLFDFTRSQAIQEGGAGLSPGEIPNIVDYVEGGTGVFGSIARIEYDVFLQRPPDDPPESE